MTLIRWQPTRDLNEIQNDMNYVLDRLIPTALTRTQEYGFIPAAELQETPEALLLKLEVPGVNPDDLEIQVSGEAISIRGERKSESQSTESGVTRSEFRYGRFQRVIPLPAQVQNDQVQANYRNGILEVTLPKAELAKNRVVKVNVAV